MRTRGVNEKQMILKGGTNKGKMKGSKKERGRKGGGQCMRHGCFK